MALPEELADQKVAQMVELEARAEVLLERLEVRMVD